MENQVKLTSTNRIMYINERGELFVQFKPGKQKELQMLDARVNVLGEIVFYTEELTCGIRVCGYIKRVTKSGISLRDWCLN